MIRAKLSGEHLGSPARSCIAGRLAPRSTKHLWSGLSFQRISSPVRCYRDRRFDQAKEPLRILYCGSDGFSAVSLRALHRLHKKRRDMIESIDVVCKEPKRVGRGLKRLAIIPVKEVGNELGLAVHELSTFSGWEPPQPFGRPINLIVAVSFGLFVPPRILNAAEYGGINVHPSLLPEYRGASPIYYQLIHGRRKTGVTLQTLHPERIDHGRILLQTPLSGIPIPHPDSCTAQDLIDFLAPKAAELLILGINKKVYRSRAQKHPLPNPEEEDNDPIKYPWAPKLSPDDRRVDWNAWTAQDILRRQRVLGPLWNMAVTQPSRPGPPGQVAVKRVLFQGIRQVDTPSEWTRVFRDAPPGYSSLLSTTEPSSIADGDHDASVVTANGAVDMDTNSDGDDETYELYYDDGDDSVKIPGIPFITKVAQPQPQPPPSSPQKQDEDMPAATKNKTSPEKARVLVWTSDQKLLEIPEIKVEGGRWLDAAKVARLSNFYDKKKYPDGVVVGKGDGGGGSGDGGRGSGDSIGGSGGGGGNSGDGRDSGDGGVQEEDALPGPTKTKTMSTSTSTSTSTTKTTTIESDDGLVPFLAQLQ